MPEPGEILVWTERLRRLADLSMALIFNAKERTAAEWRSLLAETDARFVLKEIVEPKGSALAILEIVWES